MSSKAFGTFCSRQQHFVNFLNSFKLGNNIALKGFTLNVRNIIMACYTAFLASGETLLCRSIRSSTIKQYLKAASDLSIQANLVNPCIDIKGEYSIYIKDILKEIKRWEKVPNRKEPVTKKMVEYIIAKGKQLKKDNPDNIYWALSNWLVLGQQTDFRRREWAQDKTYLKKYNDVERNIDGSPAAFIRSDFKFLLSGNRRLNNDSEKEFKKVSIIDITWRFQKNLDNG